MISRFARVVLLGLGMLAGCAGSPKSNDAPVAVAAAVSPFVGTWELDKPRMAEITWAMINAQRGELTTEQTVAMSDEITAMVESMMLRITVKEDGGLLLESSILGEGASHGGAWTASGGVLSFETDGTEEGFSGHLVNDRLRLVFTGKDDPISEMDLNRVN